MVSVVALKGLLAREPGVQSVVGIRGRVHVGLVLAVFLRAKLNSHSKLVMWPPLLSLPERLSGTLGCRPRRARSGSSAPWGRARRWTAPRSGRGTWAGAPSPLDSACTNIHGMEV